MKNRPNNSPRPGGDPERRNYGSLLPRDFPDRLERLKEASGLTWAGLAKAIGVDHKQIYKWRKGVEPSGGAMYGLFRFALRMDGGLGILMDEPFQLSFFRE